MIGRPAIDLTGQRFGRWTVIERAPVPKYTSNNTGAWWHVKCDCGEERVVTSYSLRYGISRSCGCLRADMVREAAKRKKEARYDR